MKKEDVGEFPLFKDYDFRKDIVSAFPRGGAGILLVPGIEKGFRGKVYGYGQLSVVPYLQASFNENKSFTVGDLIDRIKGEGCELERYLVLDSFKSITGSAPLLYTALSLLKGDRLLKASLKLDWQSDLTLSARLEKGGFYDVARVREMRANSEDDDSMRFGDEGGNELEIDLEDVLERLGE